MGPSLPTGRPADTANTMPTVLHTSVLNRTNRGISNPFKKHFTSGIPVMERVRSVSEVTAEYNRPVVLGQWPT